MRILVVDDDSVCRRVRVEFIEEKYPDAEIVEAANGLEAKDKFAEGDFDGIVTDHWMPGMNGLELLKFIKNSAKNVPAVMISGFQDSRQLQASVESLGFRFLKKPVRFKEFEQILSDFFEK